MPTRNGSYNKSQQDAPFLKFILLKNSTCFRSTVYDQESQLSMISSLDAVYAAIGICHDSYIDCLLAKSGGTPSCCCEYSVETPDDG